MTDLTALLARLGDDLAVTAPDDAVADVLHRSARRDARRRAAAAGAAVLLLASGSVALVGHEARPARQALRSADPTPAPSTGAADPTPSLAVSPAQPTRPADATTVATLRIPRLGAEFVQTIGEGVSATDLQAGPGHETGSALPGELGDVVVVGHRTTYGQPFVDLDHLRPGDPVVLETATQWFVYRTTSAVVVDPTDLGVVAQVPDQRLLSLVTCTPKYSAAQRLVVQSVLVEADLKADHPAGWTPTALSADPAVDASAPALPGVSVSGGPSASAQPGGTAATATSIPGC